MMTKIVVGRYTYCHADSKEPLSPVDIHEVYIGTSSAEIFFLYLSIFLMLSSLCCSLFVKGQSSIYPIWGFVLACFLVAFLKLKVVRKETVVIIPTFGIQLETSYWSGRIRRRFVSIDKILRPILNECVTPVTCHWSLALILSGENELMLVFQESRLPVRVLIPVWKALRAAIDSSEHAPVL